MNFWIAFALGSPIIVAVGVFLGGVMEGVIYGRDDAHSSVGRLNGR